ncbi:MAG: transposase, partial [Pyrinomonadaceae bacterium]
VEVRKQRGLEMADRFNIRRNCDGWVVPSATGQGKYKVRLTAEFESCSCPDFENGHRCKHLHAVEYVIQRTLEFDADGTVTETETVQITKSTRKTYPQNWRAYNAAQTGEQDKFQELLHELCKPIETPPQTGRGNRVMPLADMVFAMVFKVYSTFSARRFMSELREAKERGYIDNTPHFNCVLKYMEKPEMTALLRELITETSKPLKAVEQDFACDSSGFTTCRFVRWFDKKYGAVRFKHDWVKVHLMCGVKTNIVTAVEIHDRDAADLRQLEPLLNATSENFKISEVSADKVYGTIKNTDLIGMVGAKPFIPFKSTHTGRDKNKKGTGLWEKMFHFFQYQRDEFMSHYHKRSNVESTFSMIKRKFGDFVRSKTDVAMVNETLCKILAHNIVVLIHEMHELGIDPTFWCAEKPAAHQLPA